MGTDLLPSGNLLSSVHKPDCFFFFLLDYNGVKMYFDFGQGGEELVELVLSNQKSHIYTHRFSCSPVLD